MTEREIFTAVLNMADAAARAAFLDAACAGDAALRGRVESLLAEHGQLGSFLESPTPAGILDQPASEAPGTLIGPYKLLQQIGEGGFGMVYMAEQLEPVRRRVAIKLIKPGMDTRQVIARFEAERQALAVMDHPNIARILDAGIVGQAFQPDGPSQVGKPDLQAGRPYFVMELVRGVPITPYCDENNLAIRERLELFASVCQAIQHAHTKGIIHRDIKPTNVLVTRQDGHPVVKVIDFGIAKAMGQQLTEKTLFTDFAQMIGTPLYMSPEQAELSAIDIDTRSDIYSLGVLLYELLTGSTPVDKEHLKKAAFEEIRRIIREDEPPIPSSRISTAEAAPSIAAHRQCEPAKLARLVRGELDWIVMKALEKDRSRRYETANGFAADVLRYLADEAVSACPPSTFYRMRKFVRRNRGAVSAAASILLLLVAGTAGTTWGMVRAEAARKAEAARAESEAKERARAEAAEKIATANEQTANRERDRADEEKRIAQAVRDFLQNDLLRQADPWARADAQLRDGSGFEANDNPTIKVLLDRAAAAVTPERIEEKFPQEPLVQAAVLQTIGDAYRRLGEHAKAIDHLERARILREASLGREHHETLVTLSSLGLAYRDAGKPMEAIALLEPARDGLERTLGPEHADTLSTTNYLAQAYRAAEGFPEAVRLFEHVRDTHLKKLGPEHPDTLIAMGTLATGYSYAGRLPEAIRLYEQTRDAEVRVLGAMHPTTLMTINNLADAYQSAGRLSEAIPLLEHVRDAQGKNLGDDHPYVLTALHNLATTYRAAGKLPEATSLLEQLRTAKEKKLGPEHPSTLNTLSALALTYVAAGKLSEAIEIYEDIVPKTRRILGPTHSMTSTTTLNLIATLNRRRQRGRAIQVAQDWLEIERKHRPADDPRLALTLEWLGMSCIWGGRAAEAETALRECLAIREKNEPDSWTTFSTKSMLGYAQLGQKKYADAEPLLLEGYEGMQRRETTIPANQKFSLGAAVRRLILLYDGWDEPEQAAAWREELEAISHQ